MAVIDTTSTVEPIQQADTRASRRRGRLSPVERAEKVTALNAELTSAVAGLTSSTAWRQMLAVAARFTRYSANNQILLYVQSIQRDVTLTRVASFGTWKALGYRVTAGSRGFKILQPVRNRLRAEEIAQWHARGRNPYDTDGQPRRVVRAFTVGYVFDLSQVEPTEAAQPLPEQRTWVTQHGDGPAGLWDRLAGITEEHGYQLEVRPSISSDGQAHGWTDHHRHLVWVNSDCDQAERVRILAHELAHIRCEHDTRQVSRPQRETEADSIAYIVLSVCGLDISTSSVDYVSGWSDGDPDLLARAAESVHRVATDLLADLGVEHPSV